MQELQQEDSVTIRCECWNMCVFCKTVLQNCLYLLQDQRVRQGASVFVKNDQ